jgi:hypothetical protein
MKWDTTMRRATGFKPPVRFATDPATDITLVFQRIPGRYIAGGAELKSYSLSFPPS